VQWSDISFDPPSRTLRQFAGLALVIFGAGACYQGIVRNHPIAAAVLGALAVGIGVPGLLKPALIRHVYVGAMIAAFPIGWTVSKFILACMFYGLFTPIAVLFRLIGRDSLCLRRQPALETYWLPKRQTTDPSSYFHPF
jgi:Saxitoxin biosynthesis operon protein SxtJ